MPSIFESICPGEQMKTDPHTCATYSGDWCKEFSGSPKAVLFPGTYQQVQEIVRIARSHKTALVPAGGQTGLSGGCCPVNREVVVSLERLNNIHEINTTQQTACIQAGVITQNLQEASLKNDLYFPVHFSSQGSSQIGGNIATNVGGIHVLRYGSIRERVLGLKVVTGTGDLLELNGDLVKNNAGYPLHSLFIGSEGTLGIIVEATLKLAPVPRHIIRLLCGVNSTEQVMNIFKSCRTSIHSLSAFEYIDRGAIEQVLSHTGRPEPLSESYPHYVFMEIECSSDELEPRAEEVIEGLIEDGLIADAAISQNSKQSADLLAYRELVGEAVAGFPPHKNDVSVPVRCVGEFLEGLPDALSKAGVSYPFIVWGHVGDGNLHINVLKPEEIATEDFFAHCKTCDPRLFEYVQSFNGSISAEHGVGLLKKDFLNFTRSPEEIEYMRQIKKVFDPEGIMNPGKIFDI